MPISLAIDLGTSRTKVGWRDSNHHIHLIDWNGSPYLPSAFHLPDGAADILIGDDALEAIEDDPVGGIEHLKREIINGEKIVDRRLERQNLALDMMKAMFRIIESESLAQIPALAGSLPESVTVAIPGAPDAVWQSLLMEAAEAVGILDLNIQREPVAAARGWLHQHSSENADLLVLDCGGGTTDWALVHKKGGRITLSKSMRPQTVKINQQFLAGIDVDNQLLRNVLTGQAELVADFPKRRLLHRIRQYKETVLSNKPTPKTLRVKGVRLCVDQERVESTYRKSFVEPLIQELTPLLDQLSAEFPNTEILLVGGGAIPQLEQSLTQVTNFPVHRPQEAGLSVLNGCLSTARSPVVKDVHSSKIKNTHLPSPAWDTPDLHELHDRGEIQQWQREVADRLGVPVIQQDILKDGTPGPELTLIPPGRFLMGAPPEELGQFSWETPQHQVVVTEPYWLGCYTVTIDQYTHYCKVTQNNRQDLQKGEKLDQNPVVHIDYQSAMSYCQWLEEQTKQPYQLPTEAQWELACRAGASTPFWFGQNLSPDKANYDGNSPYAHGNKGACCQKAVKVNTFKPNPFGLYQMHGNVWEWCRDRFCPYSEGNKTDPKITTGGQGHVLRGGSWNSSGRFLRSSSRYSAPPGQADAEIGFRVCMAIITIDTS